MRNVSFLIIAGLTLLFHSCETTIPFIDAVPLRENLVMPPHQRPIVTFYLKESLDKKPVTELALIHVNHSNYATEEQLLQQARLKAQALGADGIFVLNREEYLRYFQGDIYYHPQVSRTGFRAVAFVYDENLGDSVRVHEARVLAAQERLRPKFFVKSEAEKEINLYRSPEIKTENIARVVSDYEPMEFLERTNVELYNKRQTLKSYLFKVRYRNEELYVSGFDVVRKL